MSLNDWQRVKGVFQEVLDRDADARATFLGALRREDPALHREVSSLLEAHDAAGSFAEVPAAGKWPDPVAPTSTTIAIGSRIGTFEITGWLGQGGMGAVYRARDLRLGRTVAIKLLHPALRDDPAIARRFADEARTLATLTHPNIGALFGIEEPEGQLALVLEYVDGSTLADLLSSGPIAIKEALEIAKQVADALDGAHQQGFLHRDLKPTNIKVRPDGTVKVLDFGLACAIESPGAERSGHAPRALAPGAATSFIGTPAYMSPERVQGATADRRSDVWAFGCVLFEMLSGGPAFTGASLSDVFSGVLERDPEWQRLPTRTPPAIRRLLRRCLCKDVRVRIRDVADARLDIDEGQKELKAPPATSERAASRWAMRPWPLLLVAMSGIGVTALIALWTGRQAVSIVERQFDIVTPPVVDTPDLGSFAVAPDGSALAFVGERQGQPVLWIRPLGSVTPRPLPGTTGASSPFWSPDAGSLAFYADGALKRIDIDGGLVRTVAKAIWGGGGTWNRDGTILFVHDPAGPILRTADDGTGDVQAVTTLESGEVGHTGPHFLADGRHFLFFVQGAAGRRGVYLSNLGEGHHRKLFDSDSAAVYTSGHLLFARDRKVLAQPFDVDRLVVVGRPREIANDALGTLRPTGPHAIAASANGTLAFRVGTARPHHQLSWVTRSGRQVEDVGAPDSGTSPSASGDLRTIAVLRSNADGNDVWLMDTRRGLFTRLTSDPAEDVFPLWSSQRKGVIFSSNRGGHWGLYFSDTTPGAERAIWHSGSDVVFACDESIDGALIFQRHGGSTGWDLWHAPTGEPRSAVALVRTQANERGAQISPDGRWFAYESNGSGRSEVFVQPLGRTGPRVQVSDDGGTQVRWRADGHELFYVRLDGMLMAVAARAGADQGLDLGTPVPLFAAHLGRVPSPVAGAQYVVAPDGERFLINAFRHDERETPVRVILDWDPARQAR